MSPEQLRGGARSTTATDLFSLGVVLFEMATGRRPFGGETGGRRGSPSILQGRARAPAVDLQSPACPRSLDRILAPPASRRSRASPHGQSARDLRRRAREPAAEAGGEGRAIGVPRSPCCRSRT
ncbi:MAG: hypothetical protein MZV49_06245 [Rhodopseudomonas palustris]|nr:hypothetical protein [Rhodopseudomonas palustris]